MLKVFLIVFTLALVSCENKPEDPVAAIVNGIEIRESQVQLGQMNQVIESKVIESESKRIGLTEKELLEFFDALKTRDIPKEQIESFYKAEFKDKSLKPEMQKNILDLMREKQFEAAKKKYISELMDRSTIWVIQDGKKVRPDLSLQK